MSTTAVAMPGLLDPMYWLGAGGIFHGAVLPAILVVVFIETGLLFPLLPGESLLFTGGLLAAKGLAPDIWILAPAVAVVAVLGDQCGYFIGRRIGPALFKKEDSRFFKKHYVTESHAFFEKYGPWAIILARFAPFVRTFVPVVAGVSYMRYPVYLAFDIVGGILWGAGVTTLGYFLGNVPFVHENLEKIILVILFVSMIPAFIAAAKAYRSRRAPSVDADSALTAQKSDLDSSGGCNECGWI
ncbi:MAG: DedA family protein [Mycobacterium sp.]